MYKGLTVRDTLAPSCFGNPVHATSYMLIAVTVRVICNQQNSCCVPPATVTAHEAPAPAPFCSRFCRFVFVAEEAVRGRFAVFFLGFCPSVLSTGSSLFSDLPIPKTGLAFVLMCASMTFVCRTRCACVSHGLE